MKARGERGTIACFATQGQGHGDELRIRALLEPLAPVALPFDRSRKLRSLWTLIRRARRNRPEMIVMEGTGIAGGLAVLALRWLFGVPYILSSGDAVAPFIAARFPFLRPLAYLYERLLTASSSGFIGWTPYLVGRAVTLGAPRAMVAAGWASGNSAPEDRDRVRAALGIPADAIVFGIVGSLGWTERVKYCYGLELVRALARTARTDVRVLIVGDGDGRSRLEELLSPGVAERAVLVGEVDRADVPAYLAAMDVVSLPQSVDKVGMFRYTTKLSEYLHARCPVVTGEIPLAYDLDDGWMWRLPGSAPWDERYIGALGELMDAITPEDIREREVRIPATLPIFDLELQRRRVSQFVLDAVARRVANG